VHDTAEIERLLSERISSTSALSGGCVGEVWRVSLESGAAAVVKAGGNEIDQEARALRYLTEHTELPVPAILANAPGILAMEFVETGTRGDRARIEQDAARHLAALHRITSARGFGFEWPTVIGGLIQPNEWAESWASFFGERRLVYMARLARDAGRVGGGFVCRVENLAGKLDAIIGDVDAPALVHGDVWSGNVLTNGNSVAAFIDPAIHFADREVELAFITMFGTFGDAFFERYHELFPIREGFWETRKNLYLLYPTLVHARLFGGGYVGSAESILAKYGC